MKKIVFLWAVAMCLLAACTKGNQNDTPEEVSEVPTPRYCCGVPVDSFRIDTLQVRQGETLGGLMTRAGATSRQVAAVSCLSKEDFDVRSLRVGKTYWVLYPLANADSAGVDVSVPRYLFYFPSIQETYVFHLSDSLTVSHEIKPVRTEKKQAQAVIESSLWNALTEQSLPIELALELSEIYAWTIDFFGLQKGDSIRVYYDEQFVDSVRIGIGRIYAANFYHGRQWLEAFYYEPPDSLKAQYDPSVSGYFDGNGKSLRKAFLKAPLNYKRISSHFTYARKHPIYKTVRPHTGVDYAAPMGTPVVAIGDGVVQFKAYKGGGGNTIKIKHNSTYTTAYLHLSGYAKGLAVGQRVKQGQVIGYVGSTGSSTGPHLDFRVWKNGTPVDPLKLESPPATPIPDGLKADFQRIVGVYRPFISSEKE